MKKPKTRFCWMHRDDESVQGPFPSRAAAVADHAQGDYCAWSKSCESVVYGTCQYIDPVNYLPDSDDFIERMESEAADDDEFGFEYESYRFVFADGAKKALDKALRAWAKQYVKGDVFVMEQP